MKFQIQTPDQGPFNPQRLYEERKKKFISENLNEINIIQSLWGDLGVPENFKNLFIHICIELGVTVGKDFLSTEITSLSLHIY